jgi:hypothetical protein
MESLVMCRQAGAIVAGAIVATVALIDLTHSLIRERLCNLLKPS